MNARVLGRAEPGRTAKPRRLDEWAARLVRRRLGGIGSGCLRIIDRDNVERRYGERPGLDVRLRIHDARFWSDVAFGGSIGAGEAYMDGYWSTDDLTALVRLLLRNRGVLDGMEAGAASITRPLQKALHWLNRNTRDGSRRNIASHYDVGNEFFSLVLDPTLMYSSAIFERADMTLEQAQVARLDRICRALDLAASDHLLEIGTGWGSMAIHAAIHYGCRVTTTTISREQFDLAQARIVAAGVADRVTLLQMDYRDLRGRFDKLVSIEMIEAVGHAYYDTFFAQCARLLADDGLMLLQAITIADQRYESARRSVDFIQRHVFPGSTIPSVTALLASVARATDMKLTHLDDIGPHYARTLREWRANLVRNLATIRALGYSERFVRMWEFYLCYCEGGFEERALGDVQMLLAKPGNRRPLAGSEKRRP